MKPNSIIILTLCLSIASFVAAQKKTPVTLDILPDKSSAVIAYKNGTSHIVSLPGLDVTRTFAPAIPEDKIVQANVSPDGKRLVVFHDKSKKIVVWNIEAGTVLFEVPVDVSLNSQESIYTFDPVRNQIICKVMAKGNKPHEFNVYDLTDGKLIGPLQKLNNTFAIKLIALSQDGSRILGYSGSGLDNGELEVFDYKSGEKLCEKQMGDESEITFAKFVSNDSVEVRFRYHMATTTQVGKFSITEKEKEMKGSTEFKWGGDLSFDYGTNRFVIADGVQLSGSYYAPDAYSYSNDQGWILVIARKSEALALYDTKNTTDKELNGKSWKEPTQLKSVPLP